MYAVPKPIVEPRRAKDVIYLLPLYFEEQWLYGDILLHCQAPQTIPQPCGRTLFLLLIATSSSFVHGMIFDDKL